MYGVEASGTFQYIRSFGVTVEFGDQYNHKVELGSMYYGLNVYLGILGGIRIPTDNIPFRLDESDRVILGNVYQKPEKEREGCNTIARNPVLELKILLGLSALVHNDIWDKRILRMIFPITQRKGGDLMSMKYTRLWRMRLVPMLFSPFYDLWCSCEDESIDTIFYLGQLKEREEIVAELERLKQIAERQLAR